MPAFKNTNTPVGSAVKRASASASASMSDSEFAQDSVKLDDVAIITDVLNSQKSLVKLYGTALCESSCDKLRKLVTNQLSECADDQFDSCLYMNQRNQYPTEQAQPQKVSEAKQKFQNKQKCQCK
jgi:spore coat protein CotF